MVDSFFCWGLFALELIDTESMKKQLFFSYLSEFFIPWRINRKFLFVAMTFWCRKCCGCFALIKSFSLFCGLWFHRNLPGWLIIFCISTVVLRWVDTCSREFDKFQLLRKKQRKFIRWWLVMLSTLILFICT